MSDSDSSEASDDTDTIFTDYVTLGKSSDFETVIWRFPNTDECPLKNCMLSCSSRMTCLAHFQMHHSEICMICTVCEELFLVLNPLHLLRHYQIHHPNERPPKLKETEDIPPNSDNSAKNVHNRHWKKDTDYKITLNGCGLQTDWIFPDITQCPNRSCKLKFENRWETMEHFRDHHAKQAILCELCNKPISSLTRIDFIRHYQRIHPNRKLPYNFGKPPPAQVSQKTRSKVQLKIERPSIDTDEDDFITLCSCGVTTKWRYPDKLRECILLNCHQKFKSKSDGMAHFREKHAIGSILCSLCDRPVRSLNGPNDFRRHYAHKHPNHPVPFNFGSVSGASAMKINQIKGVQVKQECLDDSDLIQLKCGEWRFPDTLVCPVNGCGIHFQIRLDAMIHYKQKHAMHAMLCHLCQKPIRTDLNPKALVSHFRNMHPNQEIPYGSHTSTNQSTDQKSRAEEVNDEDDDVIPLSACGICSQFRFPKSTTQCPVANCRRKFTKRSDCIAHYKDLHADGSILCPTCVHPIRVERPRDFLNHHQRKHPNATVPYDFGTGAVTTNAQMSSKNNRSDANGNDLITLTCGSRVTTWRFPPEDWARCPSFRCHLKFETRSDAIAHFKAEHCKNSICCELCQKPVAAVNIFGFRKHYNRVHPNVKFPIGIGLSANGSHSSRLPLNQIKEEIEDEEESEDEDDENDEDVLIELRSCGITTQWLCPKNCRRCPVKSCCRNFDTRSKFIKHYKKMHALGSICCPVCNRPIRSRGRLDTFHQHFENKHPHMKVPFKTHQTHDSDEDVDENGDVIILSALGQRMKWIFPKGLRQCPVKGCPVWNSDREVLKTHYRAIHADTAFLCELCDKPISIQNRKSHLDAHYRRCHPNAALPCVDTVKSECAPETELHSTPRIHCPLKLCSYVATQMAEMRTHWNREHSEKKFPELRNETSFTYATDASNCIDEHDGKQTNEKIRMNLAQPIKREFMNGSSTFAGNGNDHVVIDSSDSESSEVEENPSRPSHQELHSTKRKYSSDSSVWFTGIETSNDNCADDEVNAKRHKKFATDSKPKRKRRSSSRSTCSTENHMNKPRKMARKRMQLPSDNIHENKPSKPKSANNSIFLDAMKECSVILERMHSSQAINRSVATSSNSIATNSTESLAQSSYTSTASKKVFYVADSDEETAI